MCDGKNTDELSTTLTEILPLFQAKNGGKLPFTVFAAAPAINLAYKTIYDPGSLAFELAHKCKNWRGGLSKIEIASLKAQGSDVKKWCREDLQRGLANYILVESVSGRDPDSYVEDRTPLVIGLR